ncbi:hypothetical protein POVCU2_0076700 [Plasmodium ovale curtisi]|uniref:Uncharacterized protein n=1 Tax=Plasmodium ovale curtisi TaxID=864141 RepID=A0A1A8WIQ4_PLAOA|nr:hypothetical protein POVCU2_0076700 [Plasmodium ovale curtisi]
MTESLEKCKKLVSSSNVTTFLPGNAENLCQCFSPDPPNDENCKCNDITGNAQLQQAIENFQKCYGTNGDLSSSIYNKLELLTKECIKTTLREILNSVENKTICEVDMSDLKKKGESMLSTMETVGSTVSGALHLFQKVKKIFYDGQSFFSKLIQKFPGYNILYPIGVLLFKLIVIIGVFYSIIKLFRFIFCRSGKKDKENYNSEQMKQLQEQYNRALQTNTQLNNFLLGYQNV